MENHLTFAFLSDMEFPQLWGSQIKPRKRALVKNLDVSSTEMLLCLNTV